MFSSHENQIRVLNKFKNETAYSWTEIESLLEKNTESKDGHLIWKNKKFSMCIRGQHKSPIVWTLMCKYRLEIPTGFKVHRFCNNKFCCRPEHVDIVTIGVPKLDDILESDYHEASLYLKKRSERDEKTNCMIWTGKCFQNSLYGHSAFRVDVSAHVLSFHVHNRTLFGKVPKGKLIRHLCNNPLCIEPAHLKLGTYSENAMDKIQNGTMNSGENHPNCKITTEIAKKIIDSYGTCTTAERAEQFGVSTRIVQHIDSGESWCHLPRKRKRLSENDEMIDEEYFLETKLCITKKKLMTSDQDFDKGCNLIERHVEKICDLHDKKEHWLWLGASGRDRYGVATMFKITYKAHRLSYQAYNKVTSIEEGKVIRHKCRYRKCVNPACLEIGTIVDNAKDKIRDGTHLFGEKHPKSKITDDLARKIWEDKTKLSGPEISQKYGVNIGNVKSILYNQAWVHMTGTTT